MDDDSSFNVVQVVAGSIAGSLILVPLLALIGAI